MNFSIKNILLPADFSGYSYDAFNFALRLAQKNGATITLLHVVEPPYNFATAVDGMLQIMERNAKSRLVQMIDEIQESEFRDLDIQTMVVHGRTAREIFSQVKQNSIDVVVMGTKGQSGLNRVVFGSISAAVIADSPVPVFVVPKNDRNKTREIQNILFTTNLRERDPDNLKYVQSIASLFNASLDVIHIAENNDFETRIRIKGFTQLINQLNLNPSPNFTVKEHRNFLTGLAEHMSEKSASMVALNRYKRSIVQKLFGKDHTDEMMEYSHAPLLILP